MRTRNARLTAIHSLFRFAALQHPEHAALIARVLAIPPKRYDRVGVCYLTVEEITALLSSPDRGSWIGRRDHALLTLAIQTGLRVSELTGLRCDDVSLTRQTAAILRNWLRERRADPADPVFATGRGNALTTDAVAWLLNKHVAAAAQLRPLGPAALVEACARLRPGADLTDPAIAAKTALRRLAARSRALGAEIAEAANLTRSSRRPHPAWSR